MADSDPRILRLPEVIRLTGLSRSTLYSLISKEEFPKQIKLTTRSCGWDSIAVQRWINSRIGDPKDTPDQ